MLPPPIISPVKMFVNYQYRSNTASIPTEVVSPLTGETYTRLINKHRAKGAYPVYIKFEDGRSAVPMKAGKNVLALAAEIPSVLLNKMKKVCSNTADRWITSTHSV